MHYAVWICRLRSQFRNLREPRADGTFDVASSLFILMHIKELLGSPYTWTIPAGQRGGGAMNKGWIFLVLILAATPTVAQFFPAQQFPAARNPLIADIDQDGIADIVTTKDFVGSGRF